MRVHSHQVCKVSAMNLNLKGFICGGLDFSPLSLDFGSVPASRYCYLTKVQQAKDLKKLREEGHDVDHAEEHLFSGELLASEADDSEWASESESDAASDTDMPSSTSASSVAVSEDNLSVATSTDEEKARALKSNGQRQLTLCLVNSGLLTQRIIVENIYPNCFSIAPHLKAFNMQPGSSFRLPVTFRPHNTDTVYMGTVTLRHAFGLCQVPLRGVGSSALVEVVKPARVKEPRPAGTLNSSLISPMTATPHLSFEQVSCCTQRTLPHADNPAQVLIDKVSKDVVRIRNGGLLPSAFQLMLVRVPANAKDRLQSKSLTWSPFRVQNSRGHDCSSMKGTLHTGETRDIPVSCVISEDLLDRLDSKYKSARVPPPSEYAAELVVRWQIVPDGLWSELRVR